MKDKILYTKDILKLEIAEELGFSEKIRQAGWGELTSAESGKVGGLSLIHIWLDGNILLKQASQN